MDSVEIMREFCRLIHRFKNSGERYQELIDLRRREDDEILKDIDDCRKLLLSLSPDEEVKYHTYIKDIILAVSRVNALNHERMEYYENCL